MSRGSRIQVPSATQNIVCVYMKFSCEFQAQLSVDGDISTFFKNVPVPRDLLLVSCDMTGIQDIVRAFPGSVPVIYCPDDTIRAIIDRLVSTGPHPTVHVFADFVNNMSFTRSVVGDEESALTEWAVALKSLFGTSCISLYNRPIDCIGQDVFDAYCHRVTTNTGVLIKSVEHFAPRHNHVSCETLVMMSQDTPNDLILKSINANHGTCVLYNSNPDYGVEYMLQKIRLELTGSVMPDREYMSAFGIKNIDILPSTPIFTQLDETIEALKNEFGPDVQVNIK